MVRRLVSIVSIMALAGAPVQAMAASDVRQRITPPGVDCAQYGFALPEGRDGASSVVVTGTRKRGAGTAYDMAASRQMQTPPQAMIVPPSPPAPPPPPPPPRRVSRYTNTDP